MSPDIQSNLLVFLSNEKESELNKFMGNLNKKHRAIKFEFTYSKTSITFLDTKIYKNQNGILRTIIYRKPNNRRNFSHYDLAHWKSLKDSIPFSQTVRIKQICFETSELIKNVTDLKDAFIKRRCEPELLGYHFERTMRGELKVLLQTKPATQENILLVVTV